MNTSVNKVKKSHKGLQALIALIVGLAIAIGVAFARGFSFQLPIKQMMQCLSDGFFVAGLLELGMGALIWVSTTGFFDMISYGFKSMLVLFTSLKNPKEHQNFYDYKTERDEHRGKTNFVLLIVGGALIVLSLVCLWLYYQMK